MTDQATEGLLSPFLRRQRLNAARPYLNGRILDVGCGSGALAALVDAEHYLGVEVDDVSLKQAQLHFLTHRFVSKLPVSIEKFDSIISLAVIEHVSDPAKFLRMLTGWLKDILTSRQVVTKPYPTVDWIYDTGATIALFSKHANKEHKDLLDRATLVAAGNQAGLKLVSYQRFLFGANQIVVYVRDDL